MQATYLILLLAALIAMNWRFLGLDRLFDRSAPPRRPSASAPSIPRCHWRKDPTRSGRDEQVWICAGCGVERWTADNKRPSNTDCAAEK